MANNFETLAVVLYPFCRIKNENEKHEPTAMQ